MDVVALLPPYAHVSQEAVQCIAQASSRFGVPELLMHAVALTENGRTGKCVKNRDGSWDCGLMQINTKWAPTFEKSKVSFSYVAHDACTNVQAGAYILRDNYNKKGDWFSAIVAYNIGPNSTSPVRLQIGKIYGQKVLKAWWSLHHYVVAKTTQATPHLQNVQP